MDSLIKQIVMGDQLNYMYQPWLTHSPSNSPDPNPPHSHTHTNPFFPMFKVLGKCLYNDKTSYYLYLSFLLGLRRQMHSNLVMVILITSLVLGSFQHLNCVLAVELRPLVDMIWNLYGELIQLFFMQMLLFLRPVRFKI